jgi:hypothetical protein
MLNGRCSNHGGKSLGGSASPRFRHGLYSKFFLVKRAALDHLFATDPEFRAWIERKRYARLAPLFKKRYGYDMPESR